MENVLCKQEISFSLLVQENGRERGGVPDWPSVDAWLDPQLKAVYPEEEEDYTIEIDNQEIPELENYEVDPGEDFWKMFPKRDLPKKAETRLNLRNLAKELSKEEINMSKTERKRARRILEDLKKGANAYQKEPALPPVTVQNSKSAFTYGRLLTDKIATWIKKGFVAGPFDNPPTPGFRANPLAVVERNRKIRPVLNMSSPKGSSFNDNIDRLKLEKIHMATAKLFSYGLKKEGKNAIFSKYDIKDAYKIIPARPEDYGLQGFKWLNKYFCETRETFWQCGFSL